MFNITSTGSGLFCIYLVHYSRTHNSRNIPVVIIIYQHEPFHFVFQYLRLYIIGKCKTLFSSFIKYLNASVMWISEFLSGDHSRASDLFVRWVVTVGYITDTKAVTVGVSSTLISGRALLTTSLRVNGTRGTKFLFIITSEPSKPENRLEPTRMNILRRGTSTRISHPKKENNPIIVIVLYRQGFGVKLRSYIYFFIPGFTGG